ncbi:MAG: hypothetical protein P4L10_16305 [Acidobacteriaceae bacterium]|nr:hypothetical protein [Acidobacteriaceae bacterium]
MNEKKKAEEDQKMTELSAPAATTDAGKKKPAKTGSKDIKFGAAAPRFIGSQTSEFPSMEEAKKMKKGPRKDKKAPAEKKEPEAAETKPSEPVVMPTKFTNTKKKEETPAFAKLEPAPEEKEHTHAVELTSVPYAAEKAPREFAIAGLEKPKEPHEHKPYYNKPRRHEWDEERESKKELGHGGKREQHGKGGFKKEYKKDKERFSEKRGDKKEEKKEEKKEKKVTKTGDAVAKFTTVAPTGVSACR